MVADGRVSDPPRDPVLHFWEQIWFFLARKALPWDARSRSSLQSCWALLERAALL